ncbi:MAG: ZIP family metal transporter [Proteobacteria bacterium]|nr:ZIP family metal transporter [Pseudomonadota bacterium]MBU1740634.1 ZIP family metal transporter [Pseudomonadota bacterium]
MEVVFDIALTLDQLVGAAAARPRDPVFWIAVISVLGPIIGSALGVLRRPSLAFVRNMLSFAAGVMLAISFLHLIPQSISESSIWLCMAGLFLGALVMYGLDRIIPHIHPELCAPELGQNLKRTSVYLIFGIFLHNFPEGMVIAIGGQAQFSLAIALAIAIHNIPEGICTSAPFFHSTGRRFRSFLVSSSTAIPILAGFLLARYLFQGIQGGVMGLIVGATAGLMIYITVDELIPSSLSGQDHKTIFSLLVGVMFVIVLKAI